jgi:hypothetical protein
MKYFYSMIVPKGETAVYYSDPYQESSFFRHKALRKGKFNAGHYDYLAFGELEFDYETKTRITKTTEEFWRVQPEMIELNVEAKPKSEAAKKIKTVQFNFA